MAIDLRNLQGVLKTGKLVGEFDGKRARLITPVFRGDFVHLGIPRDRGDHRSYELAAVFNVGSSDDEAIVDLDSVFLQAIYTVAKAAGADVLVPKLGRAATTYDELNTVYGSRVALAITKGWVRAGDEETKKTREGGYYPGYGPGIVYRNWYSRDEGNGVGKPPLRNGKGDIIDGRKFTDGCYGRAEISIYWMTAHPPAKICYGLEGVQLLARGVPRGRVSGGPSFDTVEGAEDFSDAAEPNGFDDDLPF